jgi:hypothetical protein
LTAGTRRNGISKVGLFNRGSHDGEHARQYPGAGGPADRYTGRHADPRRKTARTRAGKAVPAAAVAATIVAGAAAYGLVAGSGHPQAAQLSANMTLPVSMSSAKHHGGVGVGVDSAASAMIRAARTASSPVAPASAKPHASPSPTAAAEAKAAPSSTPASTATPQAAATARSSSAEAPATATPSATASSSSTPAATTLSCNLSDGLLPDNVTAIVSFLLANGYTDNAAAGIAGNMYQESKGNPESEGMGGGGLIGFTPLPDGYVTGNPAVDLQTQLEAVLTYNQQWAGYLPELNAAASPADAAYIYVTDFERAGIPAASTREASAEDVASACGI